MNSDNPAGDSGKKLVLLTEAEENANKGESHEIMRNQIMNDMDDCLFSLEISVIKTN